MARDGSAQSEESSTMIVPASTAPFLNRPVRPPGPSSEAGRADFSTLFEGGAVGHEPAATAPNPEPSSSPAATSAAPLDGWVSERFGFDHFASLGSRARHGAQGLRWR